MHVLCILITVSLSFLCDELYAAVMSKLDIMTTVQVNAINTRNKVI